MSSNNPAGPENASQQPQAPHQQQPQAPSAQPVAYAQPAMYIAGPPKGKSVASMVIGLVSIFFGFTFLLPLVGLILGIVGLRTEPAGRGMAVTGIVLNGLFIVGWALLVGFIAAAGVGFLGIAATSGY